VGREIHLTADPALLLQHHELPLDAIRAEGVEFDRHLIGFNVREPGPAAPDIDPDDYYTLLAHAADFMIERLDADVVFVSMETTDIQHSHAVVGHMQNPHRAEVLRKQYSPHQILGLVGHFEFVVGMRLHFLIFAAIRGIAFTALPYASKVLGFVQELGIDTPPLESGTSGRLLARIDRAWDERSVIRARISQRLPDLQTRARETNRLLVDLLQSDSTRRRRKVA